MIVNKKSIRLFRSALDIILLNISFVIAAALAQSFDLLLQKNYMFILLLVLNILWYYTARLTGFYDDFSVRYFAYHFVNIIKNVFWQVVAAIIFIFAVKEDLFTRNFILYYTAFLITTVNIRTIIFRLILEYLSGKGVNVRNLVIIGEGESGRNFYNLIMENPEFGYSFSGFISVTKEEKNKDAIGDIGSLEEIIKSGEIEEAVIALTENESSLLDEIIKTCNRQAVKVHIIPDYFRFLSKKFAVSMIGNLPVISVRNEPLDEAGWRLIKRIFDLFFSLIITVSVLSWLFPLIALIIKIDSRGKVFFKQERIGQKNKKIKIYKFRTLHILSLIHI